MKSFYLKPKLFSVIKNYSASQLVKDIVAGIVVAIIALPLSIALAIASGVDPQCGIYTAVFAGFIVSFLGGSRVQIAGPTAAFATIVAGIVMNEDKGMDGLVIATIIAGIILVLMGVFKLGGLIKYIPYTITTGFTAGIAVTLLVGQIKDFFGLRYAEGVNPIETLEKIEANIEAVGTFSWQALVVGAVCLAILIIYPKFEKRVPPSLIAVVAGVLMVSFIPGFKDNVATVKDIPAGMPKFALLDMDINLSKIMAAVPDGFTIAILAAIESLLSCVVADGMVNSKHNPNAELVAQGAGNVVSVLFGGIPATGAIARTAANAKNGGRTPIAGMVHSVVLFVVLLFFMPYASFIPMPAIAAILFMVAYNMSEWKKFVHTVKTAPKSDIAVLVTTFVLTVVFDLVVAIAVGMVLAAVLLMKRVSDESGVASWKYDVEDDSEMLNVPANVRVFEVNGPMFFGAADKLLDVNLKDYTTVLILRMRSMTAIDSTAMNSLNHLADRCEAKGVTIILSHVNEQPLKAMKKSGFYKRIGAENFKPSIIAALEHAKNK